MYCVDSPSVETFYDKEVFFRFSLRRVNVGFTSAIVQQSFTGVVMATEGSDIHSCACSSNGTVAHTHYRNCVVVPSLLCTIQTNLYVIRACVHSSLCK
jgi:hypothetical protein